MTKKILNFSLAFMCLLLLVFSMSSCKPDNQIEPVKLRTPTVTLSDDGVASWNQVENTSGYMYKVNNGNEVTTSELSIQLSNGDVFVVKACGDGISYLDSDYSQSVTYTVKENVEEPLSYEEINKMIEEISDKDKFTKNEISKLEKIVESYSK